MMANRSLQLRGITVVQIRRDNDHVVWHEHHRKAQGEQQWQVAVDHRTPFKIAGFRRHRNVTRDVVASSVLYAIRAWSGADRA